MIAPVLFLVVALLFLVAAFVLGRYAATWERWLYAIGCGLGSCASMLIALVTAAM